jgi:hypothetical protein
MKLSHAFMLKFVSLNLIAAVIALAVVAASAPVARAATITVSNANDSGTGSLRQVIASAAAGDTITFDGDYTITLTSQLTISKNLTIDGVGHSVTVSGQNATRVFYVNDGVTFNLQNLTVANGSTDVGGGIYIPGNGVVTVKNSTFSGNHAYVGGGIYNYSGDLTVTDSAFSGNYAEGGGGIYNYYQNTTVTNSSFSANRANSGSGGGIFSEGNLWVTNSTFSANYGYAGGSGVSNLGIANLKNTIIVNSASGNNCVTSGIFTDGGGNLEDGATCGFNVANGSLSNTDAMLGAFGNYGGNTDTFPLLPGSPAIDAGNAATCAAAPVSGKDQRGQARDDWRCDIGAYELRLSDSATVVKTITGPGVYTFGPMRVKLEIAAGYTGTLSSITATRTLTDHLGRTGASNHGVGWGEYWTLIPNSGAASFAVSLTLPTLFTPDANSKVCRFISGTTWNCAAGISSTVPFTTITRSGVTAFSDWAVGDEAGPNAVTLHHLSAASQTSEVCETSEVWLLVALLVIGGGWLTRRRPDLIVQSVAASRDVIEAARPITPEPLIDEAK